MLRQKTEEKRKLKQDAQRSVHSKGRLVPEKEDDNSIVMRLICLGYPF